LFVENTLFGNDVMPQTVLTDLATRGWAIRHRSATPKQFQVIGERSSGTNFIKRLLAGNTNLRQSGVLGWKHRLPITLAIPADLTVVCSFRAADAWALSMHAKPWHCSPEMQKLTFSDFIRARWDTRIDRPRYFPWADSPEYRGQPLQADRHPMTGEMYKDLFELRTVKMAVLLSFANRHASCVFARMEAVQAAPEAFLADIRGELALPDSEGPFKPVTKRLGARFKPSVRNRPGTPDEMPETDRIWMRERLDLSVETALGYSY
jgi:hypothetical protein